MSRRLFLIGGAATKTRAGAYIASVDQVSFPDLRAAASFPDPEVMPHSNVGVLDRAWAGLVDRHPPLWHLDKRLSVPGVHRLSGADLLAIGRAQEICAAAGAKRDQFDELRLAWLAYWAAWAIDSCRRPAFEVGDPAEAAAFAAAASG